MSAYPLAIITGAARRLGAQISRRLHQSGHDVLLHAHRSLAEAEALAQELNALRANSARVIQADLLDLSAAATIFAAATDWHPEGASILVNNASRYYPTRLTETSAEHWEDLRRTNLDAPLWLSQAFAQQPQAQGCIINLIDAMVPHGMARYAPYSAAKAGLENLTRSLARELAPAIRVNAVAPGAIIWAEPPPSEAQKARILEGIPLGRLGQAEEIADAVDFLAHAAYVTGQVLAVDGGRGL